MLRLIKSLFNEKKGDAKRVKRIHLAIPLKYRYEWNSEVPECERDTATHPSRAFCKKMMELNKYYSRDEIENISMELGYSVWDFKGGIGCRHRWVQQVVSK